MISSLPNTARVWIYQSNRFFTPQEVSEITKLGSQFISSWNNHGKDLTASFEIIDSLFIVFAVDESQVLASGCSIDKSVQFIKKITEEYQVDLLNRMNLAYEKNEEIHLASASQINSIINENQLDAETLIFDNTIQSVGELYSKWKIPAKESWLNRYFN